MINGTQRSFVLLGRKGGGQARRSIRSYPLQLPSELNLSLHEPEFSFLLN